MHSLFDPISNYDTKNVESELNGDELSTRRVFGSLGGPDRDDGIQHSCTPSIDKTSADHPHVVLSRSLKCGSDDSPTSSETNCLDTAVTITKPTTDETAHESTEIVDGDDTTLEESVVDDRGARFRVRMTELHSRLIIIHCTVNATHHTLVIAEEEDGETSNAVDSNEKATLFEFVDHIGPGNDIHGGDYPECLESCIDDSNDYERRMFCLAFEKQTPE